MFIDPDGRKSMIYSDGGVMRWDFDPTTTFYGISWFEDSIRYSSFGGAGFLAQGFSGGGGSSSDGDSPIPGGTTYSGQEAYDVLQDMLDPGYDFSQFDFSQYSDISPQLAGVYAHRAMGTYFNNTPELRNNWFSEKTQSIWKWDIKMRPDLHFMKSGVNAVWELKPMSQFIDASLSLKGKFQAQLYADALTMLKKEKFFVGSSDGAPIPPINGRVLTDISGYTFSYSVPIGTDGMIYYNCLNCNSNKLRESVREPATQITPQTVNQIGTGTAVLMLIVRALLFAIPN